MKSTETYRWVDYLHNLEGVRQRELRQQREERERIEAEEQLAAEKAYEEFLVWCL